MPFIEVNDGKWNIHTFMKVNIDLKTTDWCVKSLAVYYAISWPSIVNHIKMIKAIKWCFQAPISSTFQTKYTDTLLVTDHKFSTVLPRKIIFWGNTTLKTDINFIEYIFLLLFFVDVIV